MLNRFAMISKRERVNEQQQNGPFFPEKVMGCLPFIITGIITTHRPHQPAARGQTSLGIQTHVVSTCSYLYSSCH
jgi:hypothetical protein